MVSFFLNRNGGCGFRFKVVPSPAVAKPHDRVPGVPTSKDFPSRRNKEKMEEEK